MMNVWTIDDNQRAGQERRDSSGYHERAVDASRLYEQREDLQDLRFGAGFGEVLRHYSPVFPVSGGCRGQRWNGRRV